MKRRTYPLWLVFDRFRHHRKRLTERTFGKYETVLRHFESYLGRTATTGDLKNRVAEDWLTWLVEVRGCTPVTANGYSERICCLWKWAVNHRLAKGFPDVQRLKEPKRRPRALTNDEVSKLLWSVSKERRNMDGTPAADWWRALILVLVDSGWRVGAALSLRWEHVDFAAGLAEVKAEHQKHGADDIKRLHPETLTALRKVKQAHPEVFGWALVIANRIYAPWKRIRKRAGIPVERDFAFHTFRRTMITNVAAVAGDQVACDFAQHSSVAITRARYLDPTNASRKHPVDIVGHPWSEAEGGEKGAGDEPTNDN
ncbi:MAG: tyrosine-type recombinase/integrase [Pirellulales bacterium]